LKTYKIARNHAKNTQSTTNKKRIHTLCLLHNLNEIIMNEKVNLVFESISIEDLKELIKDGVSKSYFKLTADLRDKYEKEDLMTRSDTAKFLKINLSTLYYWTKKGLINCYGIANRRYYKKSEVLERLNLLNTNRKMD
jgi:helix-turn-helix protein